MTEICPDIPDTGRYSAADAAKIIGISSRTLYRYINDPTLRIKTSTSRRTGYMKISGREIKRLWNIM